ncbi:hypothetical protein ACHAWF_010664 [Thalassiosira exigua]
MESTAPHSITMDFSGNHQFGGGDDDRSMGSRGTNLSSVGMASSAKPHGDGTFATSGRFEAAIQDVSGGDPKDAEVAAIDASEDDALAAEAVAAVSKERAALYKDNATKLQSILEGVKNSTKSILREMDAYLQETEEVEKAFIRCRANTQKESQRMERVEPDVIAATQRFVQQGAQLLGGAGGPMDFMNMAALMGAGGGGGGAPSMGGMPGAAPGGMATVTPRGTECSSMAGSSLGP